MVDYLIGVDGGGSGTRALVHRVRGEVVGTGLAGPSALQQGIPQAWDNVLAAVRRGFEAGGVAVPPWQRCALAAGLSGVSHAPGARTSSCATPASACSKRRPIPSPC
ncbi:hypothetical protein [Ramlibacter montanisoli]|uniref:hypothetical protein n=1 Tax=Ramlibacter montanisoli TaxID=2732512 RepID=UPI001C0E994C|nr:hypothetical protein [Ramlibacter montanisoli]